MTEPPVQVVEIAGGPAAAHAARFLRDLGARVTLLRPPGDPQDVPELHVGKDALEAAAGDPQFAGAIAAADVVIRQCAGRDVDDGAMGLAALRDAYPNLITVAITPFGESGPNRDHEGTNLIAQQAGGLGYGTPPRVTDPERENPLGVPGNVVEPLTGLVAVIGVLHALHQRDHDGRGRHVEVSAQDAVASLMFNNLAGFAENGVSPGRLASDRPGARRPFLPAADGQLVMMANRPHHFRAWLELLGEPAADLLRRFDAGEGPAALGAALNDVSDAWTSIHTRRQITDMAQARHIPIEPVLSPAEVMDCVQLEARGFWEAGETKVAGHPFGTGNQPRILARTASPAIARPWLGVEPERGPLSGIRVVDFTWVFAGPIATRILSALGATVIKVEAPGGGQGMGQDARRPFLSRVLHGGKLSAHMDMKTPSDAEAVRRLVASADVVVENFSTGVLERFGLGWDAASAANPGLVMASISGMGRTGPYAHHVMLGQLSQAYSGLTSIVGYEGGPARGIEDGGFWSDPVTGYAAAAAILAALRERSVTGRGRRIDVSLVEATVATLFEPLLAAAKGDSWTTRGNFDPAMAPHDTYRCAPEGGDSWLAIAVRDDAEWATLAGLIGCPALADDPRFATLAQRQAHRDGLREAIEAWSRTLNAEDAAAACQAAGIPAAPCRTSADVVQDPHLRQRAFVMAGEDGSAIGLAMPWRLLPEVPMRYDDAAAPGTATELVRAHAREEA